MWNINFSQEGSSPWFLGKSWLLTCDWQHKRGGYPLISHGTQGRCHRITSSKVPQLIASLFQKEATAILARAVMSLKDNASYVIYVISLKLTVELLPHQSGNIFRGAQI